MTAPLCGALGILCTTGCAGTPMPKQQLIQSEAAVKSVESTDIEHSPQARLYLQKARALLDEARMFMDDGEKTKAQRALEKAEYDARLALAIAKEDETRARLSDVNEEIRELRARTLQEDDIK